MRRAAPLLVILFATCACGPPPSASTSSGDPVPQTLQEFQQLATRVLEQTGVAGAGIALVRQSGVEWAGGLGLADRERQLPVSEHTLFRIGSISKTFIAIALAQLAEDGELDFDAPIAELVPDVMFTNPWEDAHPVRVTHLLQHTAGFDDMHFNEMYVPAGEAPRPLEDVLRLNPRSRRVRWPPGTRMAYSNPGYAVAGLVLERAAGMPFEDYIEAEIFQPLAMTNSSFRLTADIEARLAQGYPGPHGPPVALRHIYLRPAGNMVSTPHDLGRFVQMLLGWGELGEAFVIDPEYLGNLEQPRTTFAAAAGLRTGYGSGIFSTVDLPYKVLGHDGGIDGFLSSFAYSPSRDVGYVVLLNSAGAGAGDAMRRLSTLALTYLKRDVEAPPKPEASVEPAILDRYVGFYQDANPRNQIAWPVQSLFTGRRILREGAHLYSQALFDTPQRLVAVTDTTFRLEHELDATHVFATDGAGGMVLAGPQLYAERTSRWPVFALRVALTAALTLIASVFLVAIIWVARVRRAAPRGFWELKLALLLCPLTVLMPVAGLALTPLISWGSRNAGTMAVYLGTLAIPVMALLVSVFTIMAMREHASRLLATYASAVACAMAGVALYLSSHDLIGLRLWAY